MSKILTQNLINFLYSTCVLFLYLKMTEILKRFFFLQSAWIFTFSTLRLSSTDLNKKIGIMNSVLIFFFNCSKRNFNKTVIHCFSKWTIFVFHFVVCFVFLSIIMIFSLKIWMLKKLKKFISFFFFSFVKLVTWNDDKMMIFLILIIFYNFHLKKNDQNVKLNYMKNVKKQSIAKLIIARLLRKLGNSIYRRSGDGQTVAARGQTSKGGLILHVGPKGFRSCLFSYMMMHNNWWLLSDRGNIPKASRLRHGGIAFRILTIY